MNKHFPILLILIIVAIFGCDDANRKKHIAADYYQMAADFVKVMPGFDQEGVEYYLSKARKMREEKK